MLSILLSMVKSVWILLPPLTFYIWGTLRTEARKHAWNEHSLISLESLEIILLTLGDRHNPLMKILS